MNQQIKQEKTMIYRDMIWFIDPSLPDYVRKTHYLYTKSDFEKNSKPNISFFRKKFGDWFIIGFQLPPKKFFETQEVFTGVIFFLKNHDKYLHPKHVCARYCTFPIYPFEAIRLFKSENDIIVSNKFGLNRSAIPFKIKLSIFNRDNFRCKICGQTNKETVLHVDHIVPLSKGGSNEEFNLQTLCKECNIGKRDHSLEELI